MIRRPPRSTLDRSSAASDVYKRQDLTDVVTIKPMERTLIPTGLFLEIPDGYEAQIRPVSYTHLRAHETVLDIVCRLLLEKTNNICIATVTHCSALASDFT